MCDLGGRDRHTDTQTRCGGVLAGGAGGGGMRVAGVCGWRGYAGGGGRTTRLGGVAVRFVEEDGGEEPLLHSSPLPLEGAVVLWCDADLLADEEPAHSQGRGAPPLERAWRTLSQSTRLRSASFASAAYGSGSRPMRGQRIDESE